MINAQQQTTQRQVTGTRGGREVALLVGVLLMGVAGMIATYWIGSRGTDATPAGVTTTTGAPTAPRAAVSAPSELGVVHGDVYFDFKSTRLRADAVRLLQEKALLMDRTSTWVVLLQGHADRQGPAEYNKALAQRRAEAVKQFLVELGVPEASIKVVVVGQDGALCDDPGTECQQLNRRVHVEIRQLGRVAAESGDRLDAGPTGAATP